MNRDWEVGTASADRGNSQSGGFKPRAFCRARRIATTERPFAPTYLEPGDLWLSTQGFSGEDHAKLETELHCGLLSCTQPVGRNKHDRYKFQTKTLRGPGRLRFSRNRNH